MSSDLLSFDVDVAARRGDVEVACRFQAGAGLTVLFGPSGAGKTSALNMIAGLLKPDRGHVRVGGHTLFDTGFGDGIDVPVERRGVGYVFQDARLFPHLRVRANLMYGMQQPLALSLSKGRSSSDGREEKAVLRQAQHERWEDTVAFLDIGHLLDRWPRTLSGGEARRVAIGRALLSSPRFLLLDEPLSSLDRDRREEVMRAIEHLRDSVALPILMVTHDAGEAERLATTIVEM
jgi:molybdate transport system ATP-binding protein